MTSLTYRVTMIAAERVRAINSDICLDNHHCVSTRLQWRRGEAHVFIDWCGGTIEYQPTELLVQAVRRVH